MRWQVKDVGGMQNVRYDLWDMWHLHRNLGRFSRERHMSWCQGHCSRAGAILFATTLIGTSAM
eukprot:3682637-Amphidinium_carterae.3